MTPTEERQIKALEDIARQIRELRKMLKEHFVPVLSVIAKNSK